MRKLFGVVGYENRFENLRDNFKKKFLVSYSIDVGNEP